MVIQRVRLVLHIEINDKSCSISRANEASHKVSTTTTNMETRLTDDGVGLPRKDDEPDKGRAACGTANEAG